MSGEDEIIPYAYNNFDPNNYDNFEKWFQDVNNDFESNGRNPLTEILDPFGIDAMREVYDQSQDKLLDPSDIQNIIDLMRNGK